MIKPETLKHRLRVYLCRKMSLKNSINYLYYIQLDLCTKPNRSNLLRVKKKNIVDGIRSLFFFYIRTIPICVPPLDPCKILSAKRRAILFDAILRGRGLCVCMYECLCVRACVCLVQHSGENCCVRFLGVSNPKPRITPQSPPKCPPNSCTLLRFSAPSVFIISFTLPCGENLRKATCSSCLCVVFIEDWILA